MATPEDFLPFHTLDLLAFPNIYFAHSIPPLALVIVFAPGRLLIHSLR